MTGFTANPDDLQQHAPRYGAVADQVRQISEALTDALETEGACWGGDDQGMTFGQKYVAAALPALQQMRDTNEGLQSMVDGVCSWARNYMKVDEAVQQSAGQLDPSTG